MRLSIMDKLQREETAWRANTELITAISHDVRTPPSPPSWATWTFWGE